MIVVAVVLFVLAVAVGGVAVAGLIGKLPRNRWAGVRTEDSLRSEESFALANKVAGPTMLAAAGMFVIGGVAALTIGGVFGVAVAIIVVVVAVLTAGFGGGIGARAAAALPQQSGCGNDCNCGGHSEPVAEPVAETSEAKANAAACGTASCGACALKDACQPAH
ncbi:SdpI family protein [Rhodococcus qingshengii]|uniref:SdpI family protein n=1 Tax=Rhodococcus qingshengii TaxID=334542 RepID=UPI0036DE580C